MGGFDEEATRASRSCGEGGEYGKKYGRTVSALLRYYRENKVDSEGGSLIGTRLERRAARCDAACTPGANLFSTTWIRVI
jgi:hypothetical protein